MARCLPGRRVRLTPAAAPGEAIDLHSHVLPGVDDGPPDAAGALVLARAAVAAGTRVLAATPHIGTSHRVVPEEIASRVLELRRMLGDEGVPLQVVTGGELAPVAAAEISEEQLERITLGGSSCLLLECPFTATGGLVPALVEHLHDKGFRVLLAHPERSPDMLREPAQLQRLVNAGACVQITASSLEGAFGRTAQRYTLELVAQGLVQVVASDAHDAHRRPPVLTSLVAEMVRRERLPEALVTYLTQDAPRALLDDAPLPPVPRRPRRRGRRWWR